MATGNVNAFALHSYGAPNVTFIVQFQSCYFFDSLVQCNVGAACAAETFSYMYIQTNYGQHTTRRGKKCVPNLVLNKNAQPNGRMQEGMFYNYDSLSCMLTGNKTVCTHVKLSACARLAACNRGKKRNIPPANLDVKHIQRQFKRFLVLNEAPKTTRKLNFLGS